jgi:hypothetical protein
MRKLVLGFLTALAALAHAAVALSRAAGDLTSNDLASQLRGRCVHDGAMIAHYGIDGSYLVSGLLASGQAFSRSGTWSAHGSQRTLYFDDGDWRRDFLAVTPEGKIHLSPTAESSLAARLDRRATQATLTLAEKPDCAP